MKKLIIIRHSKSDWNHNTSDLLRPISDRGIKDAKIMSNVLNKLKINLTLRPQNINLETYYRLASEYEKLRS